MAACGVPLVPAGERQAVVGGMLEPGYSAVGALIPVPPTCGEPVEAPRITCTGTLIAPRVVLTAAHCVENADAAQVLSVVFTSDVSRALPAERVRVVDGRSHPAWVPGRGRDDIGALILAEDAPVPPMAFGGAALPVDVVGQAVRVVGFGIDDQGQTGSRRSGTAQVTGVEAGTFSAVAAPGMSCGGDSGGPVFLDVNGTERLVGVTSFGDVACTMGTNTRVDAYMPFVQEILDEIAQAPPTRPAFDPTVDTCTVPCQAHADCPLGMACVPRPGPQGGKSCAVAGLEAGRFGAVCTGPDGDRLCVKAGDACRLWLPCTDRRGGGCTVARGRSGATGETGVGIFAVGLALLVYRRSRRSRRSRRGRSTLT